MENIENIGLLLLVATLSLTFGVIFSEQLKKGLAYPFLMLFGHIVVFLHRRHHSAPKDYEKEKGKNDNNK